MSTKQHPISDNSWRSESVPVAIFAGAFRATQAEAPQGAARNARNPANPGPLESEPPGLSEAIA